MHPMAGLRDNLDFSDGKEPADLGVMTGLHIVGSTAQQEQRRLAARLGGRHVGKATNGVELAGQRVEIDRPGESPGPGNKISEQKPTDRRIGNCFAEQRADLGPLR